MKYFALVFILFLFQISIASEAEFGQYRYSKYLGIQQQLQAQRANALRKQRMYRQNPTRNIQYPTLNNPYPNIQRSNVQRLTPRQRYSANYYRTL